ncbi:MAG: hypothetical protein U0359_25640 [Byssovorax sp.]
MRLAGVVRGAGVTLDEEGAAAVLEESRRLGVHFTDVLVRWGYLDEAEARECVRAVVMEQLGVLLAMRGATALFLPHHRSQETRMSFPLAEVARQSDVPRSRREPPEAISHERLARDRLSRLAAFADAAARIEGATGAAVLDRATGAAWVSQGEPIDGELAWSLIGALVALGHEGEDVVAVRRGAAILARAIDEGNALVVAFLLDKTTVGLARSSMKRIVEQRGEGPVSEAGGKIWGREKEGTNG